MAEYAIPTAVAAAVVAAVRFLLMDRTIRAAGSNEAGEQK